MRVTVDDIAKMAGVSKATVSRVINNSPNGVGEETRKRVLQVVKDTNYEHDSRFGSGKVRIIALVQPDITNPFFADIAKAIERSATENGYMLIIANTDYSAEKEAEYISKLITQKICGIILISSSKKVMPEHMIPGKYGIPIVLPDRQRLLSRRIFRYGFCSLQILRADDTKRSRQNRIHLWTQQSIHVGRTYERFYGRIQTVRSGF